VSGSHASASVLFCTLCANRLWLQMAGRVDWSVTSVRFLSNALRIPSPRATAAQKTLRPPPGGAMGLQGRPTSILDLARISLAQPVPLHASTTHAAAKRTV